MANGMFMSPEQVLQAQQELRRAQDIEMGATQTGAAGLELGRALGGAIGGMFGAEPVESPAVKMARARMGAVQGLDPANPESYIMAARSLYEAGDMQGATEILKSKPEVATPEYGIKEIKGTDEAGKPVYETWITQDGIPAQLFEVGERKAGGVRINMGDKQAATFAYDQFGQAVEDAKISQNTITNLDFIDKTMQGIETGKLTEFKVDMARLAKSFNLPVPSEIGNLEAAQASMGDLVMGVLGKFKGAISNAEREFAASIVPRLVQTADGRKQISTMMRKMAQRAIKRREIMTKYMRGASPNLMPVEGSTFYDEWDTYTEANPLFPKDVPEVAAGATPVTPQEMSDEELMKQLGL